MHNNSETFTVTMKLKVDCSDGFCHNLEIDPFNL